jgi:hypothetical protein
MRGIAPGKFVKRYKGTVGENTYEGGTISSIGTPHAFELGLVLDRLHNLDVTRRDSVSEMCEHQRDGIRCLGRNEDLERISSDGEVGPNFDRHILFLPPIPCVARMPTNHCTP